MRKFLFYSIHLIISCLFISCINNLYLHSDGISLYGTYNIFTIPLACGLVWLLNKSNILYQQMSARKWNFIILGILFSCFYVCGTSVMIDGAVELSHISLYIDIIIFSIIISALLIVFYHFYIMRIKVCLAAPHHRLDAIVSRLSFPLLWGIIFVCWLPVLLACYPGIFSYDAIYQCSQVTDSLNLNTHHPILHTLFLGGCVQIGRSLFGSANIGMLFYSLLQMLINSCCFAYILHFMKKQKLSSIGIFLSLLFFSLMPFNSLFAICATKDSIFSALFALLFTNFYQLVQSPHKYLSSWKSIIAFSLLAFTAMAFRNNMFYAFILCIPFLLFIYRKYWKRLLFLMLLPILMFKLYEGIVYPALHVTSGDSREAYSVIMQQYANVYNNCEIDMSDKELLQQLMNDESWRKYEPHKSDIIKNEFNTIVFEDNLSEYIQLYIRLGLQYPSQYINAFFNLTYGYWYPNDILPDNTTYRKYIEVYDGGDITFASKLPRLLELLQKIGMDSTYQSIPVFSMFFCPAFYIWIQLFMVTISIYEKRYSFLTLMLLPAAFFLTILFGPVALLRYAYPIILCTPAACLLYPTLPASDIHNEAPGQVQGNN